MGEQVQKILSLWLTLALLMAPVPAFSARSALAAAPGTDHCVSRSEADGVDNQAMPGCPHCKGDDCRNHACGDSGCSPCHATVTPPVVAPLSLADFSQALHPLPAVRSASRSDPPPLRPPL